MLKNEYILSSPTCSWYTDSDSFEDVEKPKNDVFLNYSFEDVGNSFIRHLHGALRHNGFTISDHTLLPVGQDVCSQLLKAIQQSEIFVVVFSSNYASSERCLDELLHIMDCLHRFEDQRKVFRIFFKVEPSDIRNQQGPLMEAFQAHQTNADPERLQNWKQALKEAGQLSGLTLQNGDEAKFVSDIVEELEKMQSPQKLYVTEHPVGIRSRAEELISTLRLDCKDLVLVVAVVGISGVGKTTIVRETYNRIVANFDVGCFLADIHYHCLVPNWKIILPEKLISCLTRNENKHYHNDNVTKIIRLVRRRKVLLVLDGVDNFQQLEALGINPASFYNGSRIIVTTTDKRSLGNIPHASYRTMFLNRRESLNLFTRLMFARDDLVNTKFIEEIVSHAGGIPLVLKVWSSHFKQYKIEEWPSILETLKRIPHGDVQKQLQMSYDSLTNRAKKLFLDIACFFYEVDKDLIIKVLQDEDSAFFPTYEFQYLVDKSLVYYDCNGDYWTMHNAIRCMGEEVVRQDNEDEPGQRTRLWDTTDVIRVLTECLGTESVESIILDIDKEKEVNAQLEALRKMSNLRLICLKANLSYSDFQDDMPTSFSFKKLKFMHWERFPFKSIGNIEMGNVVVLRLRDSNLETLWEGAKFLRKLRILDVSRSELLTKTGDFYGLENLEELSFYDCANLEELHSSIGCLHKLEILNLSGILRLKMIPWEKIVKIPSLRKLELHHNLYTALDDAAASEEEEEEVENIYSFLSCLKSLTSLDLTNLSSLSMGSSSLLQVPSEIGNLMSLKNLELSNNTFSSLPDSLSNLSQLVHLDIRNCSELRLLPLLPLNLETICAWECRSLDIMPFDSMRRSYIFRTKVCKV